MTIYDGVMLGIGLVLVNSAVKMGLMLLVMLAGVAPRKRPPTDEGE